MNITIHSTTLPHEDPAPSLAYYRDTLGSPPARPGSRGIVLYPPAATPGLTDDERRSIPAPMAKGTFAGIDLATPNLDARFERLQAGDAEVVQEPVDQPYELRHTAFRDPAENLVRTQELL